MIHLPSNYILFTYLISQYMIHGTSLILDNPEKLTHSIAYYNFDISIWLDVLMLSDSYVQSQTL